MLTQVSSTVMRGAAAVADADSRALVRRAAWR
jgi:hypothetical protein